MTKRQKLAALAGLAVFSLGTSQPALPSDPNCLGDACDSLSFYWEAPCHKIRNIGNRPVKWKWGEFSGRLKPTEVATMVDPFGGGCVPYMMGQRTATFD